MKKNVGGTWRRIRGLGIVRLPRVVVLVMALAVSAGIPLAIPGSASAQQPVNSDLTALEVAADQVFLPPTATSVQAGTTQDGTRNWDFFLGNNSQTSVTNPTVTINSGYSPSLFPGVSSFPVTATQAGLAPGQQFSGGPLISNIPVSFTAGYNSTRTVSPLTVPAGGTQQTVVITLTPVDARYASPPDGFAGFNIILASDVQGVSLVSTSNPGNLDQGEALDIITPPAFGLFQWRLGFTQLNKTYTFTAVLNVPNASGQSFEYRPEVGIRGERQTNICDACAGSAVTVNDPTLDGSVPGSGGGTFSVAETGHTWTSTHSDAFDLDYQGTTQTPAFNFTGFFPPVDNPPTINTAKAGSAIPVKFSLGGDQGLNILASGSPSSGQIACATGAPLDAIETTVTAGGSSLSYDPTTGQYVYVWKTQKAWAGTCRQLDVQLSDGSHHVADFEFH